MKRILGCNVGNNLVRDQKLIWFIYFMIYSILNILSGIVTILSLSFILPEWPLMFLQWYALEFIFKDYKNAKSI
jgi:hypothetical protein